MSSRRPNTKAHAHGSANIKGLGAPIRRFKNPRYLYEAGDIRVDSVSYAEEKPEDETIPPPDYRAFIAAKCDEIKDLLLRKNESYGNSVFENDHVYSDATPGQAVRIRIDDKLQRIKNQKSFENEDTKLDVVGYMILELIISDLEKQSNG